MKKLLAIIFAFALVAPAHAQLVLPSSGGSSGGGGTPCTTTANSVQYNNAGAFGCVANWTSDGSDLTAALGNITTNITALTITATLSNASTTFDAPLFLSLTNNASNSASKLFDFQVGGSSFLSANGDGSIFVNQAFGAITAIALTVAYQGTNFMQVSPFSETLTLLGNSASISFGHTGTGITFSGLSNLILQANNILSISASTAGQTLRVYNTTDTDTGAPTNYERGVFDWTTTTGTLTIGTQFGGTGSPRPMALITSGTVAMSINTVQLIALPKITSDATHTDATVCEDTTTHALYSGSGAAGICLGTSSLRFKHDVAELGPGLPQIMMLKPISYSLNADHGDPNKTLYGFSAEQGSKALPQLVGLDSEGRPNTFDYMGVVPVLVHAVQQQQHEIDELKRKVQ